MIIFTPTHSKTKGFATLAAIMFLLLLGANDVTAQMERVPLTVIAKRKSPPIVRKTQTRAVKVSKVECSRTALVISTNASAVRIELVGGRSPAKVQAVPV